MHILAASAPPEPTSISPRNAPLKDQTGPILGSVKEHGSKTSIPILSLDCDAIIDSVASTLAMSLIGHVLFLKSQIPLPIMQLSRLSSTKTSPRAVKQRNELLSSFDTLASHLDTTFTALSSAFTRIRKPEKGREDKGENQLDRARVYMGIFVGSSLSSAKGKAMFAVDGLEIKAIGFRDDVKQDETELDEDEGASSQTGSDEEEEDAVEDAEEGTEEDIDDGDGSDDESGEEDDESEEEEGTDRDKDSLPPDSRSPSLEPPEQSHAEQQRTLHAAERLLARTLAVADAEGHGMSADLTPTQTHIFLRAPRRFDHPAWIPRQNISATLESTLDDFLTESGIHTAEKPGKSQKKGKVVEGVWIAGRGGLDTAAGKDTVRPSDDEWDEMIWWSWDGKIVGFSDW